MKARFYTSVSLGVALSALPFVGGCTQQNANQSASLISTASAEPAVSVLSSNTSAESPSAPAAPAETASVEAVPVPAPALDSEKKLPANIKPTGPAAEVIKLAQAGVDEAVMLNYITNASSLFVLSSDDIIYFNDLGVAGSIVTAMMQHDQGLKAAGSNQAAQPPPTAAQAAAPTYVNPPQPEPQPAPVEAAPPPAANVTYNYFNDSLAPYGTWVDVEGYGRCWQPTVVVVNRGWRPYSDRGRWVYSESGWYWMSDYSWGSTTFHYGRWFDHPRWGWCWWPDRVWAPSWVSWRYSGDYCGWAPLPPAAYYRTGFGFSYYGSSVGVNFGFGLGASCFTFVPWGRFCDSRPYHYRVPHHQVTQIYNHTTIVNNYVTGNNNTVINHGIPADRVREHTHTDLRPVRIREHSENVGTGHGGRGERLEHDGRSLVVSRPQIPEIAAAKPLTTPPPRFEATRAGARGGGARTLDTRPQGRDRNAEEARERGGRTAAPAVTTRSIVTPAPTTPSDATRANGRDSRAEGVRDRGNRSGGPTPPASGTPAYTRSAAPPTVTAPLPATPSQNESRGTPRTQEARPENSSRDRKRDGSQRLTPAPLIVTGSGNARPAAQTAPPNSIVVIGHREANPDRDPTAGNDRRAAAPRTGTPANAPRTTSTWTAPTTTAPSQQYAASPMVQLSPAPAYTPPSQPARVTREEHRYAPPQSSYTPPRPTYTPRPSAPAPVYTAPPSAPAPRSYSAPHPAPAPAYNPPPSRSQPTESRSAPERSSSGGRDNGRNRQDR